MATPRWLGDVLEPSLLQEYVPALAKLRVVGGISAELCLRCRGARLLCGKARCPLMARAVAQLQIEPKVAGLELAGSSPPGVFVGQTGWPKVYAGPLIPPHLGDTSLLDVPERWFGRSVDEIIAMRSNLVRGKRVLHVEEASKPSRLVAQLQEMALSREPVQAEALFEKRPSAVLTLTDDAQPFGPSAPLRSLKTGAVNADLRIEKMYYDRDLKAGEAVYTLYWDEVPVSAIQRAFSVGVFGVGSRRRLVPTRWSITAVDSTISAKLLEQLKTLPTVDEYCIYHLRYLDNLYVGLLLPLRWSFEWIEGWFPGSAWNPGSYLYLVGDHEPYWGRTTYASVGGCYYATRLAVAEALLREGRQAAALLLREVYEGYILPVGVWNVRESVRALLKTKPERYDTFDRAWQAAQAKLRIPGNRWIAVSHLLKEALYQTRLA